MTQPLDKTYNPHAVQQQVAAIWDKHKAYHAVPDARKNPYVIVIPPPNVTAALHMGHALNNTIQDILVRWRRMAGDNAVWIPGTDHGGIGTETIVAKRVLQEEGKRRTDFDRDDFVARIQAWKDDYEARITHQLKEMGCSCDWDRQRFTMDEVCTKAVREGFFRLFKEGLIYRGKRLVNWDPVTQTALADDEVEMREVDGQFYYLRYPLVTEPGCPQPGKPRRGDTPALSQEYITVATTRPETMLGDTAVAVNPNDPERAKYIGRKVRLPIVNREIPIIGDDYVVVPNPESDDAKAKYASGFLKVTPAHDPNDYEIGQRHGLPIINVMGPDASISDSHGWVPEEIGDAKFLLGMTREDARKAIVKWFKEHDLLEEVRPYRHSVGHSYRSHVPVEPYLSDQWYVKVTHPRLAGAALDAMAQEQRSASEGPVWKTGDSFSGGARPGVSSNEANGEGELRFYPARYAKTFQSWHENIRDWCISRQLWWGHRIPVWTFADDPKQQSSNLTSLLKAGITALKLRDTFPDIIEIQQGKKEDIDPDLTKQIGAEVSRMASSDLPQQVQQRLGTFVLRDRTVRVCLRENHSEAAAQLEAAGFIQDPDVLDTWFSSALWPISTLGWPEPAAFPQQIPEGDALLKHWNPSSTLCTAREIITLWVSRMVMFNAFFRGCLPFKDVFIHAMIQDGEGQKMSKSLGNGVDPLDVIHSHGADAMRFALAAMTTQTQDVRMPVDVVCPHTGEAFTPRKITTSAGHVVAAPIQECPGDPKQKMVTSYGAASGLAKPTDEMPLARNTSSKFDFGRNFANKLWNAARFVLSKMDAEAPGTPGTSGTPRKPPHGHAAAFGLADRWILSRLARTVSAVDASLGAYEFKNYADAVYDFFWRDYCDWYLEAIKPVVGNDDDAGRAARAVALTCLDATLRLLHPMMPYVTEALWEQVQGAGSAKPQAAVRGIALPASELCMLAGWPRVDGSVVDEAVERQFELAQQVITSIRNIRNQYNIPPRQTTTVSIRAGGEALATLSVARGLIETLASSTLDELGEAIAAPQDAASAVIGDIEVYVQGLVDAGAERQRLGKRSEELIKSRDALLGRLNNPGYSQKAPAHLVQQTRDQLAEVERELAAVEEKLAALK